LPQTLGVRRLSRMGRSKQPPAGGNDKNDRHKPGKLVRIHQKLVDLLDELAEEELNTVTEQVKIAVREYLQRRGKLPKPKLDQ
jgi:hypothetical protein